MSLQPCGKFPLEQRHLHCACPRAALPDDLVGADRRGAEQVHDIERAFVRFGRMLQPGTFIGLGIGRAGPDRLAQRLARYLAFWSLKPLQQFCNVVRRLDEHRAIADQLVAPARGAAGRGALHGRDPSPRLACKPRGDELAGAGCGLGRHRARGHFCEQQPARGDFSLQGGVQGVGMYCRCRWRSRRWCSRRAPCPPVRPGGLLHRSPALQKPMRARGGRPWQKHCARPRARPPLAHAAKDHRAR